MKSVTATVSLKVSVHTAYLAWIKFDQFRAIITRLCRPPSAAMPRRAGATGRRRQERRSAQLIEQVPDQYLAWRDEGGDAPTGSAEFEPLSDHCSRVTVFVNFEPRAVLTTTADEEVRLALLDFKAQTERSARRQVVQ